MAYLTDSDAVAKMGEKLTELSVKQEITTWPLDS